MWASEGLCFSLVLMVLEEYIILAIRQRSLGEILISNVALTSTSLCNWRHEIKRPLTHTVAGRSGAGMHVPPLGSICFIRRKVKSLDSAVSTARSGQSHEGLNSVFHIPTSLVLGAHPNLFLQSLSTHLYAVPRRISRFRFS